MHNKWKSGLEACKRRGRGGASVSRRDYASVFDHEDYRTLRSARAVQDSLGDNKAVAGSKLYGSIKNSPGEECKAQTRVRESASRNENGEPFPAPRLRYSSLPWQRPRGVANGAHRKSGVIYRLTSACPVESYLRRSAYFLHTLLRGEMQAP